jgi:hypothetical protein
MDAIEFINESNLSYFIKPKTIDDVEIYINSLIMTDKFIDLDKKVKHKYFVRLYDNEPKNNVNFKVSSNEVGVETIRNLTHKHLIYNGGSESDNSTFIGFYSK